MNFEQDQVWRSLKDDPGNYYCNASDFERDTFREWMRTLLREREVTVDFIKADGEFRSMRCTLSETLGARHIVKETTGNKKTPNPEVCAVWDINQAAWRSFRWDRIKRIAFEI